MVFLGVLRWIAGRARVGVRLGLLLLVAVVVAVGVSSDGVDAQTDPDPSLVGGFTQAEKDALIALYDATNGDSWRNKTGWQPSERDTMSISEWHGIHDSVEADTDTVKIPTDFQHKDSSNNPVPEKRVYAIELPNNRLAGTLPDLAGLTRLRILDLRDNRLTGEMPDLSHMEDLKVLNLAGAVDSRTKVKVGGMTGTLSGKLDGIKNLKSIVLSYNQFSGLIPLDWITNSADDAAGFGNQIEHIDLYDSGATHFSDGIHSKMPVDSSKSWQNLKVLILGKNSLGGQGTSGNAQGFVEGWFDKLPKLEVLDLSANGYVGRPPWRSGGFDELRELYLHDNKLAGDLTTVWGEEQGGSPRTFGKLEVLRLDGNEGVFESQGNRFINITRADRLGNVVARNPELRVLKVSGHGTTGVAIPDSFAGGTKLEVLWLDGRVVVDSMTGEESGSGFTGALPDAFASNTVLKDLRLSNNELTGVPDDMSGMTALEELRLDNNSFTGALPAGIPTLPAIKKVLLHKNGFTGNIPNAYNVNTDMVALEDIRIDRNGLTGDLSRGLVQRPELRVVSMTHNELTAIGGAPQNGQAPMLQELLLEGNKFTRYPNSLQNWGRGELKKLSLNYNEITGSLTTSVGQLNRDMTHLYLNNNKFSGTLPRAITDLSKLEHLHLQNNEFDGALPGVGTYTRMTEFLLSNNGFIGVFPNGIGSMTNLEFLDLSNNEFGGANITNQIIKNLVKMKDFRVNDNDFTGPLPDTFKDFPDLHNLRVAGNLFTCIPTAVTELSGVTIDDHGYTVLDTCR